MIRVIAALFLVLMLSSCGDEGSSSPREDSIISADVAEGLEGMINVSASGKTAVLGTDNENAKANERPSMKVSFDYDFYLGEHEVTCGEVAELSNKQWGSFANCKTDSERNMPIANVNYYDAVYFANQKSIANGFDSSYVYSSATFDSAGHCIGLEGLTLRHDVDGFRLPTEAEWIFVASRFWNAGESWNSENSGYEAHEVCTRRKSESGFCDLAGNVTEWVNDWLALFSKTSVSNYMGAPDAGGRGERVVKGGSFRSNKSSLQTYSRGDVYVVTSATHADYLGFRLAFGKIENPTWMESDGSERKSVINIRTTAKTLRNKAGSYKSKLVFRNDETGNLAFVDFSSGSLTVVEIRDTIDSYHPDISPDGSKVAFCTASEGSSEKSRLYVRDLNANGSRLVQLDVESAAIPRWYVTSGDTVIVYVSDAGNNVDDQEFFEKSTWQVPFSNGKFGTPKKLFKGAYHGGVSENLAVTGARHLRARVNYTNAVDTVWYNGEQACNASLARDGSNRTLFLDFAGEEGQKFAGVSYDVHEQLLVVDSTGKLVQSIPAPEKYAFDHTEWISGGLENAQGLAVATLTNVNGAHQKIVLVDLSDSSVTELVEGTELWHPALWAKSVSSADGDVQLNLDSAGVYLTENHNESQSEFRIKMEMFWTNLSWTNVLVVGSSRPQQGVNPEVSKNWNMLNVSVTGIDPNKDLSFIEGYALNHSENLKAIVLSLDIDNWRGVEDHWALISGGAPGYEYDRSHGYWAEFIPEEFINAVLDAYPAEEFMKNQFTSYGFRPSDGSSWNSIPVEVHNDSVFTDKESAYLDKQLNRLMDIVDRAASQKIYVIGVIFPQAPQYRKTGSFGRYGMQRSVAEKKIAWLDSMAKEKPYFVLMDENKMGNHDYSNSMAINMDHLSTQGAEQFTARLDSLLNTLK